MPINTASAKGVILFHSARWKAYLRSLQEAGKNTSKDAAPGNHEGNIYRTFHSQGIWFTRDEANEHSESARKHLSRCDALLDECTAMVDALEETLANTPKPSEILDWSTLW
jgi:hypothetical protein